MEKLDSKFGYLFKLLPHSSIEWELYEEEEDIDGLELKKAAQALTSAIADALCELIKWDKNNPQIKQRLHRYCLGIDGQELDPQTREKREAQADIRRKLYQLFKTHMHPVMVKYDELGAYDTEPYHKAHGILHRAAVDIFNYKGLRYY